MANAGALSLAVSRRALAPVFEEQSVHNHFLSFNILSDRDLTKY